MHGISVTDVVRGSLLLLGVVLAGAVAVPLAGSTVDAAVWPAWAIPGFVALLILAAGGSTVAGLLGGLRGGALSDLFAAAAAATLAGSALVWLAGGAVIGPPLAGGAAFLLAAALADRADGMVTLPGTRIVVAVGLVTIAEAIVLLGLVPALGDELSSAEGGIAAVAGGMGVVAAVTALGRPLAPVAALVALAAFVISAGSTTEELPRLLAAAALAGSQIVAVLALTRSPAAAPAATPLPVVLDHLDEAVLRFDGRLRLQDWNMAAGRLLGLDTGSVGARIEDLLGVAVGRLPSSAAPMTRVSAIGGLEIELHADDGGVMAVVRDEAPASDGADRLGRELRATLEELLRARRTIDLQRTELERASTVDPLTGVATRSAILERLEDEVAQARRYAHAVAVVLLDVDRFGELNHRFGIGGGDVILREVALRIRLRVRQADAIGRSGSDGFLAILPHTDDTGAATFAEALRRRAAQRPIDFEQVQVDVTLSAGVAVMRAGEGLDVDGLLARAEEALESARRAGGDRIALDRLHGLARLEGPRPEPADREPPTAQDSGP